MENNEHSDGPRPKVTRTVKPRKSGRSASRPIIAIDQNEVMLESGEIFSLSDLPLLIQTQPSSILVSHHFGGIVRLLDKAFEGNPLWQFRASPLERAAWAPNRKRKAIMRDCIIGYLGFKGKNKKRGHYHYPLSPETFVLKTVGELRRKVPENNATIVQLMNWAKEVRKFLEDNQLNLSPTSGGIAAQLLKDKRFYPEARRKVPRRTNAKAREHLPGNFYQLYTAKTGRLYRAAYLDQVSAHHTAARNLDFPNANSLRARGRYATLEDRAFARAGTDKYKELISQYGLFYLALETPRFFATDFPLPNLEGKQSYKRGFFYSNEIPYLKILKVRIRHIIACWTSPETDPGLNRYAEWAHREIAQSPESAKPWLKPTLLSTYGVLAAKPKKLEFGYKTAEGGIPKRYPCGNGFLDVEAKETKGMREPAMANVIHRGMVEAQTRLESLQFARELSQEGQEVLAIYADSIFVLDGRQLPLMRPPWRVQDYLTHLRFKSSTHFTSAQISKTPGVPVELRRGARLPARPRRKVTAAT